jgi:hypothetical protein
MQTLKDKEKIGSTVQDQAAPCVNVSGTDGTIDTPLTQPRSGFDLENTRRQLIALRSKLGADTPAGHRCSNLVEQLDAMRTAEGDQRAHLAKSIGQQTADLARLEPHAEE